MAKFMTQQVLWIDPLQQESFALRAALIEHNIELTSFCQWGSTDTVRWLAQHPTGVVVVHAPSGTTADALEDLLSGSVGQTVVLRTPAEETFLAELGLRCGAHEVVDADMHDINSWLELLRAQPQPDSAQNADSPKRSVIFKDLKSRKLLNLSERVGKSGVTALLTGPTGCGKEVIARVIHAASNRSSGPFVAVNCAALPEHLVEGMLFGHTKGAFTGATKSQTGAFEQAHGGTLFLDEVAELPIQSQAKLLRALQEKRIRRLGDDHEIAVDIRIIAATNQPLKQRIYEGLFREDLFYRLSTFQIQIPSLKERREDIVALAEHFLATNDFESEAMTLSACAKIKLREYHWPGNIRELENVMMRAQILCEDTLIQDQHIAFDELQDPCATVTAPTHVLPLTETQGLSDAVKRSEYVTIINAIENSSTREEAARQLGISARTLRHKLQKLRGTSNAQFAASA